MVDFIHQISELQVLLGGALVVVGGFLMNQLRSIPRLFNRYVIDKLFMTVRVEDTDEEIFRWVRVWLHENFKIKQDFMVVYYPCLDDGYMLVPAPGIHFGWFNNKTPMWVFYETGDSKDPLVKKKSIYTFRFFTWRKEVIIEFLQACKAIASPKEEELQLAIYEHGHWRKMYGQLPRPLNTIVMPDNEHYKVLEDMERFCKSEDWYKQRGIPYRRGYLFYGPPGNGKSSIAGAIAAHLGMHLFVIPLSSLSLTDEDLLSLFREAVNNYREDALILLEDIDCAFDEDRSSTGKSGITMSGLLNALDSVIAPASGRIVIMTTNHKEKLDEALIRNGRVDKQVEFRNATREQIKSMFELFFPNEDPAGFLDGIEDYQYNMSKIQEMLLERVNMDEELAQFTGKPVARSRCPESESWIVEG